MRHDAPEQLQHELTELVPNLRAFARSLSGNSDQADDLVQETLIKAWRYRSSFTPGSNLKAWLFTILRNAYLSERRRRKFEIEDTDGVLAGRLSVPEEQSGHMDLVDFGKALDNLPIDQKEALLLIGAEGFSYDEVALMCGCAVGTVKSRVNRARAKLAEMLQLQDATEYGRDHLPTDQGVRRD